MYAVNGRSFRAVGSADELLPGEILSEAYPTFEPSLEDKIAETDKRIESWLDSVVQRRNYKNIESCVSYAGDADPTFDAEGTAAKAWRSAVYCAARSIMAEPPADATPDSVLAMLPQPQDYGWPE